MTLALPEGWSLIEGTRDQLPLRFQKMFSDGTDVIIEIKQGNRIELWSSAEHRCSGPNETKESEHDELSKATDAALSEMRGWDEYLFQLQ